MQEIENGETQPSLAPAAPASQRVHFLSIVEIDETDDDPDTIFIKAIAELDTQPLPRRTGRTFADVLQTIVCISLISVSLFGIVWQVITYPHTLVILYAREHPAHITVTLAIPMRMLGPVTIARSATTATTGKGHQDAQSATGTLTFYNGSVNPQTIAIGTVLQGQDGRKVATVETVTIPAANLPQVGEATVRASALLPGRQGNIATLDINVALSSDVKVRNEVPFANGRDAREYQAVAPHDLQTLTESINGTLTQAFTTAFPIQQDEKAIPTTCHTTTTLNHRSGQEAQSVTLVASKTCSAVAYNSQELTNQATRAFTQTKPATNYHLVGSVQTTIQNISPLSVTINGKWVYTFSPDYKQLLAQKIAGDSPAKAQASLLKTGVISHVSVPGPLPPALYITFLVLVG